MLRQDLVRMQLLESEITPQDLRYDQGQQALESQPHRSVQFIHNNEVSEDGASADDQFVDLPDHNNLICSSTHQHTFGVSSTHQLTTDPRKDMNLIHYEGRESAVRMSTICGTCHTDGNDQGSRSGFIRDKQKQVYRMSGDGKLEGPYPYDANESKCTIF